MSRCLRPAFALGLALLSACTVRLELGEHRFAEGDLPATSMGLAVHERWLDRGPDGVAPAAPPPWRVAARRHGRMPDTGPAGNGGAQRGGVPLVTLADESAVAGPDSVARLITSLSGGAPVAPALGPPGIRLAAGRAAYAERAIEDVRSALRPSPEKPGYAPGPTWIPELKPLAWRDQVLRRTAPPPPPARPSVARSPDRDLG